MLLAYDQLLAEGYLEGRTGSGTYVATTLPDSMLAVETREGGAAGARAAVRLSAYGARLLKAARQATGPGPETPSLPYDFRYGEPDVEHFPHDLWRRLLARRARRPTVAAMRYGSPEGHHALRAALADYLRRARGVACAAEQVVVVSGSQQALDLLARLLLDPGAGVVIEEPHYLGARRVFVAVGAQLLPVPVDADGLDPSRIPGRPAARLAYVTPSHQFPSGCVLSLPRRLALLDWARRAGAYVVEDDYDSEYRYEGRPLEAVQGLDRAGRVIYVGTVSKVLFPALRLGYVVLPPPLLEAFRAAKWAADRGTSTLEQETLAEFIREGHFERHVRRARSRYQARRAALLAALETALGDRVEVAGANAGIHLVAWLRGLPARALPALLARARAQGVGIYPVAPCYLRPPRRAGLLLGYASLDEGAIAEGIRRLAAAMPMGPTPAGPAALAVPRSTGRRRSGPRRRGPRLDPA